MIKGIESSPEPFDDDVSGNINPLSFFISPLRLSDPNEFEGFGRSPTEQAVISRLLQPYFHRVINVLNLRVMVHFIGN